jgi:vacuolar iron transporter family protein
VDARRSRMFAETSDYSRVTAPPPPSAAVWPEPMPTGPNPELEQLRGEHTPSAVRARLRTGPSVSYLRDFIYGAVDGTITTFAIVSGVAGANLDASVVIILGLANLFADGFSMAVSNYLGTRAEHQARERARRDEERHIELVPDGEREEIRQIFAAKGFSDEALDTVVDVITADRNRWVDAMMTEELGYGADATDPLRAAAATLAAFVIVGFLPLAVFVADLAVPGDIPAPFAWSTGLTVVALGIVGALKARFVDRPAWRSALETAAVGGAAAALAFGVGVALQGVG